jgi:maltose O-acetyltransferase
MNTLTEKQKMVAGLDYFPSDKTLVADRFAARKQLDKLNTIPQDQVKQRANALKSLFGSAGKRLYIESTFKCDYGYNIHVGENFYANFGCVILDCAPVTIGHDCMLAPNVGIYTAAHPLNPTLRNSGLEFAKPITIGDNCWVGGNAVINPGVILGDNVVVGSGAVVTKSFGDNVVIAGNPAVVIKTIEL